MIQRLVLTLVAVSVWCTVQAQTFYVNNLRVAAYYIDDVGGGCSFDGENPDPRYALNIGGDVSFNVTLNPGDDKNCGWSRLDQAGLTFPSGTYSLSSSSPISLNFVANSWEEDGCGNDDTFDDSCFSNDDDYPASTSQLIALNLGDMSLGYNQREITWQGSGKEYGIRLEWDLATATPVVAMFADANFQGRAQGFSLGDYTVASLFTGVGNDNISSMQIPAGYKVIAYNNDNFDGYPITFRGNVDFVGGPNDRISSFRVLADSPSPTSKKLLIYFNGSGKSIGYQMERFATNIRADQMIFVKGVGGDNDNYGGYNQNGIEHKEAEELYQYEGFDAFNPFPTTFYSTVNAFKNTNNGGREDHYVFGVDMDYDGSTVAGYEDEDSYVSASNVLRVLRRYNLRDYDTIVISGHSRGSAVGISSFLYALQKAKQGDPQFSEFQGLVNDVFDNANVINVVALDPVAGDPSLPNDFHMGGNFRMREIYAWLKTQYGAKINFTELYANGGRMLEADELAGLGGYFSSSTFDPSPNYLHIDPSNNVQRYWLGYRHSTMVNKTEKWFELYDNAGIPRPWLLTADMLNAALENQTSFRDFNYWHFTFRQNDLRAWYQALKEYGCSPSFSEQNGDDPLDNPDADLEFQHYHGTRHTTFGNSDAATVDMNTFVPTNNIRFNCTSESLPAFSPGLKTASNSHTENGWTYYCNCEGELLLALALDGTGADVPNSGVTVQVGTVNTVEGDASNLAPDGVQVKTLPRTWNVTPNVQPSSNVGIRLVYPIDDEINLSNAAVAITRADIDFYAGFTGVAHDDLTNITSGLVFDFNPMGGGSGWSTGVTESGYPYAEISIGAFYKSMGAWATTCPGGTTLYVDANVATPGRGTTWNTAMTSLGEALAAAHLCPDVTTILVAAGTYTPSRFRFSGGVEQVDPNARRKTFHVRNGLTLMGGYNAATGQRDVAANATILSGNIGESALATDNIYNVLYTNTDASGAIVIDGFTITGGYDNGPFSSGGAIYSDGSNTSLNNCRFTENFASFTGGAVRFIGGIHTLTNNLFDRNHCTSFGSSIGTFNSDYTGYNNTFADNTSSGGANSGTAIYHFQSTGTLVNTIFHNNTQNGDANAAGADIINGDNSSLTVTYSLLQPGHTAFAPSPTNFNAIGNPLFTNAATGDYTLQASSPAINTGTAMGAPMTDRFGVSRPQGAGVDMGAYEYSAALPVELLTFTGRTDGAYNRLDWTTATEENNEGFQVERSSDGRRFESIGWVAGAGTTFDPQAYTFQDQAPLAGISYYRLAQTDYDGTVTHTAVVSLQRDTEGAGAPIVFPNPMVHTLTIDQVSTGVAILYNSLGQPIHEYQIDRSPYTVDVQELPAGQYLLRIITTNGQQYTQHLVK